MTKIAAALCLRLPTLSEVVQDLVRKRWVTRRRSVTDTRVVHLRLSQRGNALVIKIEPRMHHVKNHADCVGSSPPAAGLFKAETHLALH
jgi:DNA-binding MarR family transcriptional regulator